LSPIVASTDPLTDLARADPALMLGRLTPCRRRVRAYAGRATARSLTSSHYSGNGTPHTYAASFLQGTASSDADRVKHCGHGARPWPCSGGQSTAVNSAKGCPPVSGSVRRYRTVMRAARCWRCLRRAEGSQDDRRSAGRDRTVVTWPGVAAGQEAGGSYSVLDMRSCDGVDGVNLRGLVLARRSGFVRCPAEARVSRSVRPGRR
jgi:hypothetical protein